MLYLRGRYYSSKLHRFITEDPAKDGLNWYAYCENNPVMFVDPLGLLNVPYNGSKSFSDLIDTLTGIIDIKAEYENEKAKNNPNGNYLTELAERANNARKIDLNAISKYSPELSNIVKNNVIYADNSGMIQQVSSVLAVIIEMREETVIIWRKIGEPLVPEDKIKAKYEYYRKLWYNTCICCNRV